MCFVLKQRQQNEAFLADAFEEEADGSLGLELGTLSATTGNTVVSGECVEEIGVYPWSAWTTLVDFPVSPPSLSFLRGCLVC